MHLAELFLLPGLQAYHPADCTAIPLLSRAVGPSMPALWAGCLLMAWVKYPLEGLASPSHSIQIFSFKLASAVLWQEAFGRRRLLLWSPGCPTGMWGLGQASWALRPAAGLRHSGAADFSWGGPGCRAPHSRGLSQSSVSWEWSLMHEYNPLWSSLSGASVHWPVIGMQLQGGIWLSPKGKGVLLLNPIVNSLDTHSVALPVNCLNWWSLVPETLDSET